MKRLNIIPLVFLFFTISLTGHTQIIELSNAQVQYEETLYPTIRAVINPEPKAVKKAWSDHMNDKYDVNMRGFGFLANKDVLYAEETTLGAVSEKQLNFYTKIVRSGEQTSMDIFAKTVQGEVIDPDKDTAAFQTLNQMLITFLDGFLTDYYREKVDTQQEEVNDLADDIQDLTSDIEKAENRIDKLEKEIEDLKSEIERNKHTVSEKESTLVEEKSALEARKRELETIRQKLESIKSMH